MSWDPHGPFMSHSAPEPDGVRRRSGESGSFNSLPSTSQTIVEHTNAYDRPSASTSRSDMAGFRPVYHEQFSGVSPGKMGGQLTGYPRRNATHDFGGSMNHASLLQGQSFDFTAVQDFALAKEPTEGTHPGNIETELSSDFGSATNQYTYNGNGDAYQPHYHFYAGPSSLHPNILTQSSSTGEEPSSSLQPLTTPNLHRKMNQRHLSTTNGDPATANSELFKEDTGPKVVTGIPILIAQNTLFTPIHEIERPPSPSAPSINNSENEGLSIGDGSTLPNPSPDKNVNRVNGDAFPDDPELRDLWNEVVSKEIGKKGEPLHAFLEESVARGSRKKWRCRFSDNAGRCNQSFLRRDKALGHIRESHLQKRPYACGGSCGDPNCSLEFSLPAKLSGHLRNLKVECDKCHQYTSAKNLGRHRTSAKCRRSVRGIAGGNS